MRITDLPAQWRQRLTLAQFRNAFFHVERDSRGSGRRVALHEFPKRNQPYAEDMGRKAIRYTCQGYIIVSPFETDYIPARDALYDALEADGPGILKLPTFEPLEVMVESYNVSETREKGGIAIFDMQFVERGKPLSYDVQPDTEQQVGTAAQQTTAPPTGAFRLMMVTGRTGRTQFFPDTDYFDATLGTTFGTQVLQFAGATVTERDIEATFDQLQTIQRGGLLGLNQLFLFPDTSLSPPSLPSLFPAVPGF